MSSDWILCFVALGFVVVLVCALSYCAYRASLELHKLTADIVREWTHD